MHARLRTEHCKEPLEFASDAIHFTGIGQDWNHGQ